MSEKPTTSNNISSNNGTSYENDRHTGQFSHRRWSHALALADQLRHNTLARKNEQLRQFAFDLPSADVQESSITASVEAQTDHVNSFQNELLGAKTGNFNLDSLTEYFLNLKHTFNQMLELDKDDIQQITLATSITKTALLIVLRSTESIVDMVTKGTRCFPTLNSLISYIRSRHKELPIHGSLLVEWYQASNVLDLLLDSPDWLVQPRKAYWAMQVCNETLAWARVVFSENYCKTSIGRPIFDRDDSVFLDEPIGQE
ncbi:unnamed protein product [Rotaria sp. Silwood2]|nr:unnamed protein product [Rotaria sp. Silwood2]CAF2702800.1 unnamed protein product [Rotaria sp. Silwood2]CAF4284273.1 unnamed protein product [Rotaria sp. Silwood2]CAF4530503.1 unnamed protein product [Rotaria sp. Silwood2]